MGVLMLEFSPYFPDRSIMAGFGLSRPFHMLVACIITGAGEAHSAEYAAWITIRDPRRVPAPQGPEASPELLTSRRYRHFSLQAYSAERHV